MKIRDLYCCAGLASDGYAHAGLAVEGLDVDVQPDYPYPFTQGDALDDLRGDDDTPDARHTSPPCQLFTTAKHLRAAQGGKSKETVDLLTPTMALLRERWNHKPWVVENVEDNQGQVRRMMAPRPGEYLTRLCGSMFGLQVQRHRLFLTNFPVRQPACRHDTFPIDEDSGKPRPWGVYHVAGDAIPKGGRTARDAEHGRQVMGSLRLLPWDKLKEGFPPAYTAHIGRDLLAAVAVCGDCSDFGSCFTYGGVNA